MGKRAAFPGVRRFAQHEGSGFPRFLGSSLRLSGQDCPPNDPRGVLAAIPILLKAFPSTRRPATLPASAEGWGGRRRGLVRGVGRGKEEEVPRPRRATPQE